MYNSSAAEGHQIDVESLMRERLPYYAVNCLLAAGYDTPDVICSMNITTIPLR
jgi:hypothetical protein